MRFDQCAGWVAAAASFALVVGVSVSGPAGSVGSRAAGNLDLLLERATTDTAPAISPPAGANPLGAGPAAREDALPGVLVLSDGTALAGMISTTLDRDLEVWVEAEQRWRHVPLLDLLGLEAVVVSEDMEKEWRWKETGSDERYYTGRSKPVRRLLWRLHLIDDSHVTGAIKGQPLWIDDGRGRKGPFILHERSDGPYGHTIEDMLYMRRLVISRTAMVNVRRSQAGAEGQ